MEAREAIQAVIKDTHASMWGRAFDVSRPAGLEAATDFILDLMQKIEQKMHPADPQP